MKSWLFNIGILGQIGERKVLVTAHLSKKPYDTHPASQSIVPSHKAAETKSSAETGESARPKHLLKAAAPHKAVVVELHGIGGSPHKCHEATRHLVVLFEVALERQLRFQDLVAFAFHEAEAVLISSKRGRRDGHRWLFRSVASWISFFQASKRFWVSFQLFPTQRKCSLL